MPPVGLSAVVAAGPAAWLLSEWRWQADPYRRRVSAEERKRRGSVAAAASVRVSEVEQVAYGGFDAGQGGAGEHADRGLGEPLAAQRGEAADQDSLPG